MSLMLVLDQPDPIGESTGERPTGSTRGSENAQTHQFLNERTRRESAQQQQQRQRQQQQRSSTLGGLQDVEKDGRSRRRCCRFSAALDSRQAAAKRADRDRRAAHAPQCSPTSVDGVSKRLYAVSALGVAGKLFRATGQGRLAAGAASTGRREFAEAAHELAVQLRRGRRSARSQRRVRGRCRRVVEIFWGRSQHTHTSRREHTSKFTSGLVGRSRGVEESGDGAGRGRPARLLLYRGPCTMHASERASHSSRPLRPERNSTGTVYTTAEAQQGHGLLRMGAAAAATAMSASRNRGPATAILVPLLPLPSPPPLLHTGSSREGWRAPMLAGAYCGTFFTTHCAGWMPDGDKTAEWKGPLSAGGDIRRIDREPARAADFD
ncbi:hypothetical protein BDW02DRAFT_651245 [Decorospora gaudefroyi]|uniref:Uncharacterized protein n=1 Tax=Decorospora gaudefroyi TaxID=184978 RepID=A0A6A5JYV7_9PLEO|nr:hypothetical protein BDW02DRAFT_651245 [Decorospora gaudefroyi]